MRKVIYRCRSVVLAFVVAPLVLCACERVWYLTVEAVTNGRPEFCFTRSAGCKGEGVQFSSIIIAEVDKNDAVLSQIWALQPKAAQPQDYVIKHLAYGVVPKGWAEDRPAPSLRDGAYYSVNGQFIFALSAEGTATVYSLADFLDKRKVK